MDHAGPTVLSHCDAVILRSHNRNLLRKPQILVLLRDTATTQHNSALLPGGADHDAAAWIIDRLVAKAEHLLKI